MSQLRDPAPAPRQFHRNEVLDIHLSAPKVTVTTLDFCPFDAHHILVGYADGDLSLYNTKHAAPLRTWTSTSSLAEDDDTVIQVRWSQSRPGVFLVLFKSSELQVWDLIRRCDGPISRTNLIRDFKISTTSFHHQNIPMITMDVHREGYICVGFINTDIVLQLELGSSFLCDNGNSDNFDLLLVALRKRFSGLPM